MKSILVTLLILFAKHSLMAQYGFVATGASVQNGNGKMSNSIGQVAYKNTSVGSSSSYEGMQQPLTVIVSVKELEMEGLSINTYPNPSFDKVLLVINDISQEDDNYTYSMITVEGKTIMTGALKEKELNEISIQQIEPGCYELLVYRKNDIVKVNRIIKN